MSPVWEPWLFACSLLVGLRQWHPKFYSWQYSWYYQGIAWQSVCMSPEDSSRTWRLPSLQRVCCGHSTLSGYNCPETVGSVAVDPLNWWIGVSPYWPTGGRLVPPLQLQIQSPEHLVPLSQYQVIHAFAKSHLTLWPGLDLQWLKKLSQCLAIF